MKEDEVINLSKQCNFNANQALPLKLEASGREYWRVINDNDSLVLCYLDPSKGDHSDFIKITNSLKENNVNSVDIFYHNADLGVTLQQDLGDNDLLTALSEDNKFELLKGSLDLLISIFNTEGNFNDKIGKVSFVHIIFTEPTPTLKQASAAKMVAPIIFF